MTAVLLLSRYLVWGLRGLAWVQQVYFFNAEEVSNSSTPVWRRGPLGIPVTPEDVGLPGQVCDNMTPSMGNSLHPRPAKHGLENYNNFEVFFQCGAR